MAEPECEKVVSKELCEARREKLTEQYDNISMRLDKTDIKIDRTDAKIDRIDAKIDRIDSKVGMSNVFKHLFALFGGACASWFGRDALGG